jgi:hypothetical protein
LKKHFDLDEVGEVKEYAGCKVDYGREKRVLKLSQPVLVQSFEGESELPSEEFVAPAAPGESLCKGEPALGPIEHGKYRKGVGKLIHLAKYSRADLLNSVREVCRFGANPTRRHLKAMHRIMKYCVQTRDRGLLINPHGRWDGSKDFLFEITGYSDSTYASCKDTFRSVSGWSAHLNGAPYVRKSKTQRFVTLSVTEAECVAAAACVQDMLYGKRFLESIELQVKLPMTLYMDNKGGVDVFNNWSTAGHTRAVSVRFAFIRELKEQGILQIKWIKGGNNPADMFTKNLDRKTFEKHAEVYTSEG